MCITDTLTAEDLDRASKALDQACDKLRIVDAAVHGLAVAAERKDDVTTAEKSTAHRTRQASLDALAELADVQRVLRGAGR